MPVPDHVPKPLPPVQATAVALVAVAPAIVRPALLQTVKSVPAAAEGGVLMVAATAVRTAEIHPVVVFRAWA